MIDAAYNSSNSARLEKAGLSGVPLYSIACIVLTFFFLVSPAFSLSSFLSSSSSSLSSSSLSSTMTLIKSLAYPPFSRKSSSSRHSFTSSFGTVYTNPSVMLIFSSTPMSLLICSCPRSCSCSSPFTTTTNPR